MCGRYTRVYDWVGVHALLDATFEWMETLPERSWNVAPSQRAPVCVLREDGSRELRAMRWGLTPRWSKDGRAGPINARSETVASKPMFREAYRRRRCLAPMSGFYEWKRVGDARVPHYFWLLNDEVFCVAGLWERWEGEGEAVESFTILTTRANEAVAEVHDRMPVIVRREDYGAWLEGEGDVAGVFEPWPAEEMGVRRVSSRVNSVKNDDAGLCEESSEEGGLWV